MFANPHKMRLKQYRWKPTMASALLLAIAVQDAATAASVSLAPAKDNTLIQWSPTTGGANPLLSNGLGDIYVGRTNQDGQEEPLISIRRGLLQFDLANAVPAGATVTNVTLTLRDVMGRNGDPAVALHRLNRDWGEGTSFFQGGQGTAATDGDATWLYAHYYPSLVSPNIPWTTVGGDFDPVASASAIIFDDLGEGELFTWSGAGLVADVQHWLANPSENFGWLLRGDEEHGQTAKRLNSGESTSPPNTPPQLTIEYAFAGDYNSDGAVDAADYVAWRHRLGTTTNIPNETVTLGEVTPEDYDPWADSFGTVYSGNGSAAQVPESTTLGLVACAAGFVMARQRRQHNNV